MRTGSGMYGFGRRSRGGHHGEQSSERDSGLGPQRPFSIRMTGKASATQSIARKI